MPMTPAPTITRVRGILAQGEDAVRIEDVDVVEGDAVRAGGTGADGDNYFVGAHPLLARPIAHGDRVVVYQLPPAMEQRHPVPGQLVPDHLDLSPHDMVRTAREVVHGDVVFHPVALPV